MAKFPTEIERSVTVKVPMSTVYDYLWDVVGMGRQTTDSPTCMKVASVVADP